MDLEEDAEGSIQARQSGLKSGVVVDPGLKNLWVVVLNAQQMEECST